MPTRQYYEKILQDRREAMATAQKWQRESRVWSDKDFLDQMKKIKNEIDDIEKRWANDPDAS